MKKEEEIERLETHLGYIQSIISRMAQNSFQAKAWGITVVSGLLAFCLSSEIDKMRDLSIIIACVVTLLFCLVDSYYLYLERGYRELYNIVAGIKESSSKIKQYDLSIPSEYRCIRNRLKAVLSWSTGGLYIIIIALLIVLKIYLL